MSTRDLTLIALFAAVTAVLGLVPPIEFPGMAVPITAQSMGPMLAGAIIGGRRGALSQILFLAVVAVGAPLLSGGRGGLGVFAGPSAGYLFGFPPAAGLIGFLLSQLPAPSSQISSVGLTAAINAAFGIGVVHLLGVAWLAATTDFTLPQALLADLAFVPGDLLKCVVAALVAVQLRRIYPELVHGR